MPNQKTKIDGVKASIKRLTSERRNEYIQLKQRAPKSQQEHVREAYLFFQDEAMMDVLAASYL